MRAADIPTRETLAFVERFGPAAPGRVLEVGCGAGELAAALAARGHEVAAIDPKAEAVAQARANGVPAEQVAFLEHAAEAGSYDALFFGRVLHHVEDLAPVVARAAELLRPGGVLLVEDYAWERVERPTASWVLGLMHAGRALGVVPEDAWDLTADPLAAWHANTRAHGLFTSADMRDALGDGLEFEHSEDAPYAYRWFARYLAEYSEGAQHTEILLAAERDLIREAAIVPIGWRAVARSRKS